MPVSAKELFDYAYSTPESAEEIRLRSAVSRAYYAAYHTAKRFHCSLAMPGILPVKAMGNHEELYYQLLHPSIRSTDPAYAKSKEIGYKAKGLKAYRVKADYTLEDTINSSDMAFVIEESRKVMEMCN